MEALSERLEVRLAPQTVRLLRKEAQRRGLSMAQLVREAVDLVLKQDTETRLRAAEALFQVCAPTADWILMKREIEEAHHESSLR